MSLKHFLAELRHRNVLKVATAYLAGGWLVLEVGNTIGLIEIYLIALPAQVRRYPGYPCKPGLLWVVSRPLGTTRPTQSPGLLAASSRHSKNVPGRCCRSGPDVTCSPWVIWTGLN